MTPTPTGRLLRTATGRDLVLTRRFRAPVDDVWASIAESERTARWIGPWTAEAGGTGVAGTVVLTMTAEEGSPTADLRITACAPPHHLAVSFVDEHGTWELEVTLHEADGVTELTLTHHLAETAQPGDTGPGWEYYLDRLVASRDGELLPDFDDYYPTQRAYYEEAAAALAQG
ncbi:MAG: SRPBCC family protein [Actinomycetes bacterium]